MIDWKKYTKRSGAIAALAQPSRIADTRFYPDGRVESVAHETRLVQVVKQKRAQRW